MFATLLFLFIFLPILEISLLLQVGEMIGGWNTIAIVIVTAIVGAHLVRQQGLSTLMQVQRKMQTGQMPASEMAEGLLLVISGVLLVTPGFVTDFIGLLFAMPVTRPAIAKSLLKQLSVRVVTSAQGPAPFAQDYSQWQPREQQSDIIEGEFERKDPTQTSVPTSQLNRPEDS